MIVPLLCALLAAPLQAADEEPAPPTPDPPPPTHERSPVARFRLPADTTAHLPLAVLFTPPLMVGMEHEIRVPAHALVLHNVVGSIVERARQRLVAAVDQVGLAAHRVERGKRELRDLGTDRRDVELASCGSDKDVRDHDP